MFGTWKLSFGFYLIVASCLLVITPASAYPHVLPAPAIGGPTGLARIPSADILPYKNYNVGMDYGVTLSSGTGTGTNESVLYYKMNLGTFHGIEVGVVGGKDGNSDKLREGVFVNLKLSLSSGDESYPLLLALGVENLFSYTKTDVYMVATKYFKQGPKLTFGFMADFPNYKFRPLGMLGLELAIADNLFLLGDLMAGETLFQVNAGCRFYITPIFSVNLTGLNVLDGTQVKDQRTALLGFSWANPF